jgi:hypothetical protein
MGDFCKQGRIAHHPVRDAAGQLNDLGRNGTLGIDKAVPLVDDATRALPSRESDVKR